MNNNDKIYEVEYSIQLEPSKGKIKLGNAVPICNMSFLVCLMLPAVSEDDKQLLTLSGNDLPHGIRVTEVEYKGQLTIKLRYLDASTT